MSGWRKRQIKENEMTQQLEAMKQALEAFEWNYNTDLDNIPACEQWAKMLKQNITVLRQAIEQAEKQERTGSCPLEDCNGGPETHGCWAHNCEWKAQKQEPVAWLWELTGEVTTDPDRADGLWLPLYTSPPQRQPLTDEQIAEVFDSVASAKQEPWFRRFSRAIEAAHGIKGEA
jgi:hypothetical protein